MNVARLRTILNELDPEYDGAEIRTEGCDHWGEVEAVEVLSSHEIYLRRSRITVPQPALVMDLVIR